MEVINLNIIDLLPFIYFWVCFDHANILYLFTEVKIMSSCFFYKCLPLDLDILMIYYNLKAE